MRALALEHWRSLTTDEGAAFDKEVVIDAADLRPHVSWGTNPSQVVTIDGSVPEPVSEADERALAYMGLEAGTAVRKGLQQSLTRLTQRGRLANCARTLGIEDLRTLKKGLTVLRAVAKKG